MSLLDPVARRAAARALARELKRKKAEELAAKEAAKKQRIYARHVTHKRDDYERGMEFAHRMGREYALKVGALPYDPEAKRRYHEKHREKHLAAFKAYWIANKDKIRARKKRKREEQKRAAQVSQ